MGYFKDAFDISAGATLGNMAVNTGVQVGAAFVDAKFRQAYTNYRSQYFDPVVRQDMNDLLVFGKLPQQTYPFPGNGEVKKQGGFFGRHKVFTTLLLSFIGMDVFACVLGASGNIGDLWETLMMLLAVLMLVLFFGGIIMIVIKIGSSGKKVLSNSYKGQLICDGRQYWYVREYVRQSLERGEMVKDSAVRKICNTSLARQFPDTVDQIEANAFYYRKRLGM